MTELHWLSLIEMNGMVVPGHFVFNSFLHGDMYVNKRALLEPGRHVDFMRTCTGLAELCAPYEPTVLVGPREGAEKFAQHTSIILSDMLRWVVPWVPAIKLGDGSFEFRLTDRHLLSGRIAIIEDIMTTGGSIKRVMTAISSAQQRGARICSVSAIVDRTEKGLTEIDSCPVRSLVRVELDQWSEKDCPQCQAGVPVNTDLGHSAEFMRRQHAAGGEASEPVMMVSGEEAEALARAGDSTGGGRPGIRGSFRDADTDETERIGNDRD